MAHPSDDPWPDPPRRWAWVARTIGWDGGLPVLVALLPEAWIRLGVDRTLRDLLTGLFVPMLAGLVRAGLGRRQIERAGHERGLWWRQAVFGSAICVLMFFEAYVGIVQLEPGPTPAWVYGVALGVYLLYLVLILVAVRPSAESAIEGDGTGG